MGAYAKYGFCHRINDKGLDYNALCLISSCEIWRHFLNPMGIQVHRLEQICSNDFVAFAKKFKNCIWFDRLAWNWTAGFDISTYIALQKKIAHK